MVCTAHPHIYQFPKGPLHLQTKWPIDMILGDSLETAVHFPTVDRADMLGKDNESGPKPGV